MERVLLMDDATVVWDRPHCCADMAEQAGFACEMHPDPFECGDRVVYWSARFDEYGLIVHDGGATYLLIANCPWCGASLPEPKRDRWFDELEAMGIEDPLGDPIPEAYESDAWYREAAGA